MFPTALVLLLTAVVLSAGCVGMSTPVTEPLAGDPVLGEWLGNRQITQINSSTNETVKISMNCRVKILADGKGTVAYHYGERGSFSFSHSFWGDVTVSKQDNVYTLDGSTAGVYVMTLSEDGVAMMTIPGGLEMFLWKGES